MLSSRHGLWGLLLLALAAHGEDRLHLNGRFIEGGLVIGQAEPGAQVRVDDVAVSVSPEGYFLLGFHRDAPAKVVIDVHYRDGRQLRETHQIEQRDYDVQRINGLPDKTVNTRPADQARITREAALIAAVRQRDDPRNDFLHGFIWPVEGPISGVYGSQRILNGQPRQPHYGVDIARPVGTPAKAPADGVITLAEPDLFFTGGTLTIDHGHGLTSWFLHLSKIRVQVGQVVRQGEVIAEIGATGRVTGPHLDWRMNLFDKRIDPALLVPPMPAEPQKTHEVNHGG